MPIDISTNLGRSKSNLTVTLPLVKYICQEQMVQPCNQAYEGTDLVLDQL